MAMNYTTLVAAKTVTGSIANWVNYSKLTASMDVILEDAQALLYQVLRIREMVDTFRFTMTPGTASVALPSRFLDPIGDMFDQSQSYSYTHKDDGFVLGQRTYAESSGSFAASPFSTTIGSRAVVVTLANHGFSQDSSIFISGASAVGGLSLNGTHKVTVVTTNTFTIFMDSAATSTAVGGGAAAAYTVQNLYRGTPYWWAILEGRLIFDNAFSEQHTLLLRYFRTPELLSATNLTNWLTSRYPHLLRVACVAAAADFMKDDAEYQKAMQRLGILVERSMIETDYTLRGAEIMTETP